MPVKKKTKKKTKRDYFSQHKKNFLNEAIGNKNKLEPGMIVRFNYRGKDVHEPRPLVLVLNPK